MIFRSVSNTDFRARVRTLLLAGSTALAFVAAPVWAFSIDDVASKAKDLAGDKYSAPTSNLPSEFSEMKFADYQQIRFINERAYWGKLKTPFKLSFYHQGMHFDTPVKINEVTATTVKPIKYDRTKFDFGSLKFDENATKDLGYAGFRVLYPINKADKQDEIATFLGASYFRVVGKGQVYGLSARGLAIDTALPSGEEFPRFREFWIERPKAQDKQLVIYALLDSPRATGAYRFVLRPGKDAVMDVQARVFLRDKVSKLGLAPLTSMYLFGSNQPSEQHNFRPELHDSSGLQIHAGNGEWLWRPLNNPKHLSVSTFSVENPKASACSSAAASSPATKTWTTATTCVRAPGSSRRATGARAPWNWWKSRPRTKPTTISSRSGTPRPSLRSESRWTSPTACTGPWMKTSCTTRNPPGSSRPCARSAT